MLNLTPPPAPLPADLNPLSKNPGSTPVEQILYAQSSVLFKYGSAE